MSVLDKKSEIEQIADALLWDAMGTRMIVRSVVPELDRRSALDEDYKGSIIEWSNRLYIANQIAYILTYGHHDDVDKTINMIGNEREWLHGGSLLLDFPRFYQTLESIRYNLYSNGGQYMLSGPDTEKLDNLIAVIAREIVGMYQKGSVN